MTARTSARGRGPRVVRAGVAFALFALTALAPRPAAAAVAARRVVGGLSFPAAFTFAPNGRIFYGERFSGEIRIYNRNTGSNRLFFRVGRLATDGEQGLLGLELHPRFPDRPFVYAYATRWVSGTRRNQILRIRSDAGVGVSAKVIFSSSTVAGSYHDGGRILFGPKRKLFAVVGDAHNAANAQDKTKSAGKLLRINPDGSVPRDNPFGNRIWAYGIRNSYGFAVDPLSGRIWETENGPQCNDEINRIRRGGNFAWGPHATCSTPPSPPANTNQDGRNRIMPRRWFTPPIAPTGAVFCSDCRLPGGAGALYFGAWNTGQIRRIVLNSTRTGISSMKVVFTHSRGVLSMERPPGGGAIYFSDRYGIWKLVSV